MDSQKMKQALKDIFDLSGPEVTQDDSRFNAYLEDLLPGSALATERTVLRHAAETSAL